MLPLLARALPMTAARTTSAATTTAATQGRQLATASRVGLAASNMAAPPPPRNLNQQQFGLTVPR